MAAPSLARLLDRLEELQRDSGAQARAQLPRLLRELARRRCPDAASLIRFHESLLFLRAYPPSAALLHQIERMLATFKTRVDELRARAVADFETFSDSDVSGIAGTGFTAAFGYDITRWLARAHPRLVKLAWDRFEQLARIITSFPRFLPLFAESAYVDASVPFRAWLRAAKQRNETELAWLLRQFAQLPLSEKERAELFEPMQFWVRWELGDAPATRTHMRIPVRTRFFQRAPLLARRDVALANEFAAPPMPVEHLTRARGARLLAQGRDAMAVRFRELHGFTYGDPATVRRADLGRGVEVYLWGVPAERRLPTLAYHALLLVKNDVPCGYAEGLSLFERTEIGVNIFYTFRNGESAWLYARLMRLFQQLLGVSVFSIDPYQLGAGNEEGIESGAYWFYRKLGFRPTDTELVKLDAREADKIATRAGYRTPASTLRKLATGHVLYEAPQTKETGAWDRFHVHHIGLRLARRMSREFAGDAAQIRRASVAEVRRALDRDMARWREPERAAFADFALVLALIPDLARWSGAEQRALVSILRAKAGADELDYLRLLQRHARLRRAIIALGTSSERLDEDGESNTD